MVIWMHLGIPLSKFGGLELSVAVSDHMDPINGAMVDWL
jgi:hypothetical protein